MNEPLISVIVPIFMVDRYVGVCIESILNQTYSNLEIILVDDGSKDRCSEICDLYSRKDHRIKVIHKSNGGLVSARKSGLSQASGEFVCYVDGDDWVEPGFIESLYTTADESHADMVCAGYSRDIFSKSVVFTDSLPAGYYGNEELEQLWKNMLSFGSFYRPGISTYVWNKLFRRTILMCPQYAVDERISIGEDSAVTYPALLNCKGVVITNNADYHYRQREDSMLKQKADHSTEVLKIRLLYDYLIQWGKMVDPVFQIIPQIIDYILSIAIIRIGGIFTQRVFPCLTESCDNKNVIIYSAGTFGQQLIDRLRKNRICSIKAWVDDDYREYRRCCLDVDPVDCINGLNYDYILIATVDSDMCEQAKKRLLKLGISPKKIVTVKVPENKQQLLDGFLGFSAI